MLLAIAMLAAPAAAPGATLSVNGTQVRYQAAPGESNDPQFNIRLGDPGETEVLWHNDNVPVTPGTGCAPAFPGVLCTVPTDANPLTINLGDGHVMVSWMKITSTQVENLTNTPG